MNFLKDYIMIFNYKFLIILFFLSVPGWGGSSAISAVSANTSDMQKIGQGKVYYLGFIKVYDASLYSSELTEAKDVLSRDVSKCLHLEYTVDIDRNDFVKVANTVLNRQFSEEQLARVESDIESLHQGYRDVRDGDSYTLCYNSAEKVTSLSYNGEVLVSVDSPDFAEIYFSIWLGSSDPLDETLRDDLLAGLVNN
jgi:hypothetical protein